VYLQVRGLALALEHARQLQRVAAERHGRAARELLELRHRDALHGPRRGRACAVHRHDVVVVPQHGHAVGRHLVERDSARVKKMRRKPLDSDGGVRGGKH
jgi:hypothetical protein